MEMYLPEEASVNRKVKNRITKFIVLFIVVALIAASIFTIYISARMPSGMVDSKGEKLQVQVLSIEDAELGKKLSFKQNSLTDIVLPEGKYNIELVPQDSPVASVKIYGAEIKDTIDLRIDDVPEKDENAVWKEVYAIDPTSLEFEKADVTAVAKGFELWKCKEWNFKKQECFGEWHKLMDITPGEYYSFVLTKDDPGLAELGGTFFEGFESASLAANNWTLSGTAPTFVTEGYAGNYSLQWGQVSGVASVFTPLSTSGYRNISISFYARTASLDTGEYAAADWYNGTAWIQLMSVRTIASWTKYSYTLTPVANNKSNLRIRLRCLNNQNAERCWFDNVQVVGQFIPSSVNVTINGTIIDAENTQLNSTIVFVKDLAVVYNKTSKAHNIKVPKGKYNISIDPHSSKIKKLEVDDANFSADASRLIEIDVPSNKQGFNDLFAINPKINYKYAKITATASQNSTFLLKCKEWNFTARNCYGSWNVIEAISPGQEYDFYIDASDPGFAEGNEGKAVLIYHFDNNQTIGENSTFVKDSSGHNNNGNVYGATYAWNGKAKGGFSFDGINDYIEAPDSSLLRSSNFSIGAWVKLNSYGSPGSPIITKWEDGKLSYWLGILDNQAYLVVAPDGNTSGYMVVSKSLIGLGKWYHVAATYNGAVLRMYINGTLENSTNYNLGVYKGSSPVKIGNDQPGMFFFNGTIDEPRIYNTSEVGFLIKPGLSVSKQTYSQNEAVNISGAVWSTSSSVTVNIKNPSGASVAGYPKSVATNANGMLSTSWTIPAYERGGSYKLIGYKPSNPSYNASLTFVINNRALGSAVELPDSGALSGTYDTSTGTYTNTWNTDTNYYAVQTKQTGLASAMDILGNITLGYDLKAYNLSRLSVLEGYITYCHAASYTNGCTGGNPAQGTPSNMNIFIYSYKTSKWIDISDIPVTSNNLKANASWIITSNFTDYVNASGWLRLSLEFIFNNGKSAFLTDYAPVLLGESTLPVINSAAATPNPAVQNNTVTITANVTDNYKLDTLRFSTRLPNGSIISQKLYQTWLFDGFDDGNSVEYAINFSNPAEPGVWSVKANKVYQQTASTAGIMFSHRKIETFDDFTYSTNARITEAYNTGRSVGIIFRWVNYGNYYLMDHYSGNLRLIRFANNLPTVLNTTAYTLTGNTWYTFKVKFVKNKIEAYVNNVLVMKGTDGTFSSGTVGFRLQDYSGEFDNLTVMRENEIYKLPFNMTKLSGTYNYTVYANDSFSNQAASKSGYFIVFSQGDVPKVKILLPTIGRNISQSAVMNFSVNATDPDGISSVKLNITYGATTDTLTLTDPNLDHVYTGSFSNTSFVGTYNVRALATDTKGIFNRTQTTHFNTIDNMPPTINSIWDIPDPDVQYQPVYLYANVTDGTAVKNAIFEVTQPNGTKKNFTGSKLLKSHNYQNNNVSEYAINYSNPSYPGTWAVVNLAGNLVYRQSQNVFSQYFSTIKNQNYTDFDFSVMVRPIDAIQAGKSMATVFRYQNRTNYYLFDNYNSQWRLVKVVNNTATVLSTASGTITINTWHNMSVYAVGNQIRGYADGVQKVNATDNSIHIGTVGFRLQQYQAEFDNLSVYDRRPIYNYKYNATSAIGLYSYKVFAEDTNSLKSVSFPSTFLVAGALKSTLKVESGENPLFREMISLDITQLNTNNAASVTMKKKTTMKLRFSDVNSTKPIIGIGKVEILVHYKGQTAASGAMTLEGREASQLGDKWCNATVAVSTSEQTAKLKCDDRHIFTEDDLNNLVLIVKNNQNYYSLYIEYAMINYTYAVRDDFSVRITSPLNTVYNSSTIPLTFKTYNGTVSSCKYSVNKGANISTTNTTTVYIYGFEGTNNVTVYCSNTLGKSTQASVEYVIGKLRTLHPVSAEKGSDYVTFDLFSIDNIYTQLAANEFVNITKIEGLVPEYATKISSAKAFCYVRNASNGARLFFRLKAPLENYTADVCYGTTNQQGYLGCDLRQYNISSVDELNNLTFSCHIQDADGGLPASAKIDEAFVNVSTALRPITSNATINLSSKLLSPGVTLTADVYGLIPSSNVKVDIARDSVSVSGYPKTVSTNASGYLRDTWTVPLGAALGDYVIGVNGSDKYSYKTFVVLPKYNISGSIKNSTGALIPATIKVYYENMTPLYTSTDTYNLQLDYGRPYVLNVTPSSHKIKNLFIRGVMNIGDMDDILKLGKSNETVYAINPRLKFTNATVTVSSGLPAGSFGYFNKCTLWDFSTMTCIGNWTKFAGINADTYTLFLTQGDPGFAEGISTCVAEDKSNKGAWNTACDGTYPGACGSSGDRLKCNDGYVETHVSKRLGGTDYYAGVRIKQYNASITNCGAITSVRLCYEWWGDGTKTDCAIRVDANGGASWSTVTTACPGSSANPGVTCTNVTTLETWTCANFFGASGTRAEANAELVTTENNNDKTHSWDVFYFDVLYNLADSTPPTWVQTPTNRTIEYNASLYYDLNATDNVAVDKYIINDTSSFKINALTGVLQNNTKLSLKTYYLMLRVNDTKNNNLTRSIKVTVQDTTQPSWTQTPTDRTITLGSSLYYDLNATDNYQIDKYSVNDTASFTMNAATGVLQNSVALALKTHWLAVKVNDTKGNLRSTNIKVFVQVAAAEEPGLVMEWIDPDTGEIDKEQDDVLEVQNDDQGSLGFVYSFFGNIFSMFAK